MMFTTDLALRMDPIYAPISQRFHKDPAAFADAFAKAWYKLYAPRYGEFANLAFCSASWFPRPSCGRTLCPRLITS